MHLTVLLAGPMLLSIAKAAPIMMGYFQSRKMARNIKLAFENIDAATPMLVPAALQVGKSVKLKVGKVTFDLCESELMLVNQVAAEDDDIEKLASLLAGLKLRQELLEAS